MFLGGLLVSSLSKLAVRALELHGPKSETAKDFQVTGHAQAYQGPLVYKTQSKPQAYTPTPSLAITQSLPRWSTPGCPLNDSPYE